MWLDDHTGNVSNSSLMPRNIHPEFVQLNWPHHAYPTFYFLLRGYELTTVDARIRDRAYSQVEMGHLKGVHGLV